MQDSGGWILLGLVSARSGRAAPSHLLLLHDIGQAVRDSAIYLPLNLSPLLIPLGESNMPLSRNLFQMVIVILLMQLLL